MAFGKKMRGEAFRYSTVVAVGYAIDILVSVLAMSLLSLNLPTASAVGFLSAFLINYILHEFWTFKGRQSRLSFSRLFKALGAASIALAVRIGLLTVLAPFVVTEFDRVGSLIAAAGLSFLVNYALLRLAVFRRAN